jgi:acetyl esterase/lipase
MDELEAQHEALDVPARVRVYAGPPRATPRPAVLWIHGGGYVIGSARQDDGLCVRLASELDAVVVSVDYRLAPEHPFPTPLEDCCAAFELIHREASLFGVDPRRVAIAGQSAGGGLAAALALLLQDRGRPAPVLQLLVYPMLDDRTVLREVDERGHRLWNASSNRYGWSSYLAGEPGSPDVPDHAVEEGRSKSHQRAASSVCSGSRRPQLVARKRWGSPSRRPGSDGKPRHRHRRVYHHAHAMSRAWSGRRP